MTVKEYNIYDDLVTYHFYRPLVRAFLKFLCLFEVQWIVKRNYMYFWIFWTLISKIITLSSDISIWWPCDKKSKSCLTSSFLNVWIQKWNMYWTVGIEIKFEWVNKSKYAIASTDYETKTHMMTLWHLSLTDQLNHRVSM